MKDTHTSKKSHHNLPVAKNDVCYTCKLMNMFKASKAKTVSEYIAAVPDNRKEAIKFLHDLIKKTVPKLKPYFATNMIGYGKFKYIDYKKREGTWPIIALANQKQYISIYVCATDGKQHVAEKYEKDLGKVHIGRSCIRLKKIEDINVKTLQKILKEAEKSPGLVSAKK